MVLIILPYFLFWRCLFNCSINWAWNVRRLENMQDLRVIYYAAPKKKETQTPDTSGCNMAKVPVNKPDTQYHQEKNHYSRVLSKTYYLFSFLIFL